VTQLSKQTNPVLTTYERYSQSQLAKAGTKGVSGLSTPTHPHQQQQTHRDSDSPVDGIAHITPIHNSSLSRPGSALGGEAPDGFIAAGLNRFLGRAEQWTTIVVVGCPGGAHEEVRDALSFDGGLVILPKANVRIVGLPRCNPR
jgi:hypothetical protein